VLVLVPRVGYWTKAKAMYVLGKKYPKEELLKLSEEELYRLYQKEGE
jgi:hypothetical protein